MVEGVGYTALYLLSHAAAHCVPFILLQKLHQTPCRANNGSLR